MDDKLKGKLEEIVSSILWLSWVYLALLYFYFPSLKQGNVFGCHDKLQGEEGVSERTNVLR